MTNPNLYQQQSIVEIIKCTNYQGHNSWKAGKATKRITRYKGKTADDMYFDLTKGLAMSLVARKNLPITVDEIYTIGVD